MTIELSAKRAAFRRLHESGCFVLPNPWDAGSARLLESLGFKALASTSAGFAWSLGRPDNGVSRDEVLGHLRQLCAATDLPVNADFEGGFARDPEKVAANVKLAIETGVAGLSVEDLSGEAREPYYEKRIAAERIRAARAAIDETGTGVILVARAEQPVADAADLATIIDRLSAFAEAGADCLYAPGVRRPADVAALVAAVAPLPVNILMGGASGSTVAALADLGVRRISVGGALARVAWGAFIEAAEQICGEGSFAGLAHAASGKRLNDLFSPR